MKILFTCGGTAGHINPALALAGMFQARNQADILFVGADGGMEQQLVPREGYQIQTVTISSFWRQMNLAGLKHNFDNPAQFWGSQNAKRNRFWTGFSLIWLWGQGAMPRFRWCGRRRGGGFPLPFTNPTQSRA